MLRDGPEEILVKFVTNLLERIDKKQEIEPSEIEPDQAPSSKEEEAPQENIEQFLLQRLMSGE